MKRRTTAHHSRALAATAAGLCLGAWLAAGAAAADAPEGELHYRVEIGGEPAGRAVERIVRDGDRVTTETALSLRLRRGASEIGVELWSSFVETADGEPVELRTRQVLGRLPVETRFRFRPQEGTVEVTTRQADRETRETVPAPAGDWLTPEQARRAAARHGRTGAERYRLLILDPFAGLEPVVVERRRLERGRWRETQGTGGASAVSTLELDGDGRTISSSTRMLGTDLTLVRVAEPDEGQDQEEPASAPELLVSTLVRPDRPIPEPRRLRRAVYSLSARAGAPPPAVEEEPGVVELLSEALARLPAGAQRVERGAPGRARGTGQVLVSVDVDRPGPRPLPADADGASGGDVDETLEASSILDHRDPAVRELLARALGGVPPDLDGGGRAAGGAGAVSDAETAVTLTAFVARAVSEKTLDTGFATASEVARTGAGDCTEHAVLLAALLRAAGIPSRVVSGLVYLESFAGEQEVFGYHLWTQALVDGRWLDLDAALAGAPGASATGFDATHLALGVSTLSGPNAASGLSTLAPLAGRLALRVVRAEGE